VKRHPGDILVGIDVSGHDYLSEWEEEHRLSKQKKNSTSLKARILDKLIPDNLDFNYLTVLSRASSLMIRQNSILMAKLIKPDILVDIQMSRYGTFDFDKSERIIAVGRQRTAAEIGKSKP
jgi:NTE family protein